MPDGERPLPGHGGARGGRSLPWRALALAAVAVVAVLGVARVAGADAGTPGAGARPGAAGWEPVGEAVEPGRTGTGPTPEPSAPAETAVPTVAAPGDALGAEPPDWWAVLAELDRRRAQALTALDPDLLAAYAHPGSAAWSADATVVADLRERGLHPEGLTSRVLAVERSERQGEQVRVQVVDQRSAYALVDDRGSVVQSVPEAGLTRWTVTLAQEPADPLGWRVVDVTAS